MKFFDDEVKNSTQSSASAVQIKFPNRHERVESENDSFSFCRLDELFYLEYASTPVAQGELSVGTSADEAFYVIYCDEGEIEINLSNGASKRITPFQSSLIHDRDGAGIKLKVLNNGAATFSVLVCEKPDYKHSEADESCYEKYRSDFCKLIPDDCQIFTGVPCLKLTEKIKTISQHCGRNASSHLIVRGLIYEIFGIKLAQMYDVASGEWPGHSLLTERELKEIHKIASQIKANPSMPYSIEFICRKTGLSPAKLQEGFKNKYGNTVINFIRDCRLEKATELIQSSDLNISEIVYSIGLTSRSYFSKIFKEKYRCSPKYFQDQRRIS